MRGARGSNVVETYLPYWQNPQAGINVVLKTAGDPHALIEPMRRAVKEVNPGIAVATIATMDELVGQSIGTTRDFDRVIKQRLDEIRQLGPS